MKTYAILQDSPGVNGTMIADTAETLNRAEDRILELKQISPADKFTVDYIDVCEFCFRAPVAAGEDFCSESCYIGWQHYMDDCAAYERDHPTFSELGVA